MVSVDTTELILCLLWFFYIFFAFLFVGISKYVEDEEKTWSAGKDKKASISTFAHFIRIIAFHGKNSAVDPEDKKMFTSYLFVPKSYFTHFYLIGLVFSVYLLLSDDALQRGIDWSMIGFLGFCLHCLRRYNECIKITIFGKAKISVVVYIGALLYYLLVPLTFYNAYHTYNNEDTAMAPFAVIYECTVLLLFIYGNILQYDSHRILYQSKAEMIRTLGDYTLPNQGLFKYVVCPHYFAEILIYLSFLIFYRHSPAVYMCFIWVVTNLSVFADENYRFYTARYPEDMKKLRVKRIIPFLY